ncbi:MAG: SH3 domain-containing protein [Clostridia bacterium]|nr:SH3 domain-containing protein [Clostridia bacterium]
MKKFTALILSVLTVLITFSSCRRVAPGVVVNEKNVESDEFVPLAPGVSKEMMDAAYWIKDGYTDVVLNEAQIRKFNTENNKLIGSASSGSFSLQSIKETISGITVREIIESIKMPDPKEPLFINGAKVGNEYAYALTANIAKDAVPEKVEVKFGFSVCRDTMRKYPTADYANNEADDYFYDSFTMSDLLPFSPLAVLHESADGEWLFVASYVCCGWVARNDVAICSSRSDWLKRQSPEDFLVVTGREIRLSEDPYCKELSNLLVPMGVIMPLVKLADIPSSINRRSAYGCYVVKLPVRLADGSLSDAYSLIPHNSDVSVGYLPLTRANVINLAFKLQGDIYGWAGAFNSSDCSGIIRQIFMCFGMQFPRVGSQQVNALTLPSRDVSQLNEKEKLEVITSLPAGSLLYFSGHIMIYLGTDSENEPYALSSVGSISTTELSGEVMQVNTVLVSSVIRTVRKTGVSWLGSISKILALQAE